MIEMNLTDTGVKKNRYNVIIYIIVLLACLVPRYISTLKFHMGLNFSYYTIVVVAVTLLNLKNIMTIRVAKNLEFSFFWI